MAQVPVTSTHTLTSNKMNKIIEEWSKTLLPDKICTGGHNISSRFSCVLPAGLPTCCDVRPSNLAVKSIIGTEPGTIIIEFHSFFSSRTLKEK